MIIELLLSPIFLLVDGFISLIPPVGFVLPNWFMSFVSVVRVGLSFFPSGVFAIVIGNIAFWLTAHMIWAIIEWLYKKVPGVS